MKRITQSLFEEIEKITSGQIEEKKKVDHDKDRDNDFADVMMARMKAGGKSHKEAHAATRKHNEEAELQENISNKHKVGDVYQPHLVDHIKNKTGTKVYFDGDDMVHEKTGKTIMNVKAHHTVGDAISAVKNLKEEAEQLDEIGDTPAGKKVLGSYVKKRVKQVPKLELSYQMAPSNRDASLVKKYQSKVNKGIGRAVDRLTKEEAEIEEAWPGTKEYKEKFPKDEFTAHMQRFGGDPKAARATKGRYGNLGPSGSETGEKPENISKPKGRGRKAGGSKLNKMKEETIVKHDDFMITVTDNPTFQDFFNAAKTYVEDKDDAVVVAEAFYKDEDNSIIIESEVKYLYNNVFEDHKKDGYLVEDIDVVIREEEVLLKYSAIKEDSGVKYNYIHHGIVVAEEKGEE